MFYRTAESVSPKHPDKLCDQISDAILDAYLKEDPDARVAAEACGGHGVVFVTGEITSTAENVDIPAIVKRIAGDNIEVHTKIVKQSPEIAAGVDTGGAGDQGIMIGYACDETPEMLPREVVLSRRLNQFIYEKHPYDGKTQITIAPDGSIDSIVASFQNVPKDELEKLVRDFIAANGLSGKLELHINPAGDWNQGGFDADTGLTGRKLIVDNYGPRVAIGGGCYEKEAFDYDLYWVRNCDVLVVNLNKLDSIGTAQEIMLAHTLNKPIIMICAEWMYDDVHPWYKEEATRFFLYQSQTDLSEVLVDVGNYIITNFRA